VRTNTIFSKDPKWWKDGEIFKKISVDFQFLENSKYYNRINKFQWKLSN
jgi:hypothetical protein